MGADAISAELAVEEEEETDRLAGSACRCGLPRRVAPPPLPPPPPPPPRHVRYIARRRSAVLLSFPDGPTSARSGT